MKNIIIYGAGGMIGKSIRYLLKDTEKYNIVNFTKSSLDIYDEYIRENLTKTIEKNLNNIDFVINCVGVVKINKNNIREYIIVNSLWPIVLGKECKKRNIKVVNISTDYVFDSHGNIDDIPSTQNIYGISKYLGEYVHSANIRTSIIGENNNCRGIIEWVKRKKNCVVMGDINKIWSGTTCYDLGLYIKKIIDGDIEYWAGVKHLTSVKDGISKYDLIKLLSDIYSLNITVVKHVEQTGEDYIKLDNVECISENFEISLLNSMNIFN